MSDARPRVLACCGGLVIVGGLERMILEALRVARERGGAVHCIVNSWGHERISAQAEAIGATWSIGRYHHRLRWAPGRPVLLARLAWDILCTSAGLLRDARRFRPTHVLIPEFATVIRNAPALVILRLLGLPVILALQNAPATSRFYQRLWKWAVDPFVDRYVCSSQACRRQLVACGIAPEKALVVYNCAPPRQSTPATVAARDFGKVIFVGQIIPEKGLDLLLDAVGLLVAHGRDVRLDVVGQIDGWIDPAYAGFRDRVIARAAAPDLTGRVRLLGFRDDVPSLMRGAAVHCNPSRAEMFEGLPLAVLEAKEAGIPSVAFQHDPFPELIEHERSGWLCRETTSAALAEGLDHFLGSPAPLFEAAKVIAASTKVFSRDAFAAGWSAVWNTDANVTNPAAQDRWTAQRQRA